MYEEVESKVLYISVALPLALSDLYTYAVPEPLISDIAFGKRVEVPLRSKLYAGIVVGLQESFEGAYKPRKILGIIDEDPVIDKRHFDFWSWIASYYCCSLGEVMAAALPGGLKLASESVVSSIPDLRYDHLQLSDNEFLILEALSLQNTLDVKTIHEITSLKSVYNILKRLLDRQLIQVEEELLEEYSPKRIDQVRIQKDHFLEESWLEAAYAKCSRSSKQKAVLDFLCNEVLVGNATWPIAAIIKGVPTDRQTINALAQKELLGIESIEVSRIGKDWDEDFTKAIELSPLSFYQEEAVRNITNAFNHHNVALIHGVTGSGKTRLYMEWIHQVLQSDKQVLFLVPEIALTTHLVERIEAVFGDQVEVFHSRLNPNRRVDLWHAVKKGKKLVVGARSAVFLPFVNLGLIVVDEEHDDSFKQQDPAPRYHARDVAVYLAHSHGAKVILGSATPSMESYYNAYQGKYHLETLEQRYGQSQLPNIQIINLAHNYKVGKMRQMLSLELYKAILLALEKGEQVLLFQNRRGYSPILKCRNCGYTSECPYCDITLKHHKYLEELRCHYCNYMTYLPTLCPQCQSEDLKLLGFGTEKIEEEVKELFPEARVARLDVDTAKSVKKLSSTLHQFDQGEIDILVGTQMVAKGLDIESLMVVGVLSADSMLQFPDFRASERSFQMITQVAGRAGRRTSIGQVFIQAFVPDHPVLGEVVRQDYIGFFHRELAERQAFIYPPIYRMIEVEVKHRDPKKVDQIAQILAGRLRQKLDKRVKGPAAPMTERLKNWYRRILVIKMRKDVKEIIHVKQVLTEEKDLVLSTKGYKSARILINVDP